MQYQLRALARRYSVLVDSTGATQWGGVSFIAHCDAYGIFEVALYRWNGRRLVAIDGARGMCLSE